VTFASCIPIGLFFAHRGHLSLRKLSKATDEQQELADPAAGTDQPRIEKQ
jgi:hypothetical protein